MSNDVRPSSMYQDSISARYSSSNSCCLARIVFLFLAPMMMSRQLNTSYYKCCCFTPGYHRKYVLSIILKNSFTSSCGILPRSLYGSGVFTLAFPMLANFRPAEASLSSMTTTNLFIALNHDLMCFGSFDNTANAG